MPLRPPSKRNTSCFPRTTAIGIALCPDHGTDFETLYHAADRALYHVKNHGKGDLHVYSPEDEA